MTAYPLIMLNHAERGQRQIEPLLMRVAGDIIRRPPVFTPVKFTPCRLEPIRCTPPMIYGTNTRSPRDRMRHQVQLGEGAPGWRGRMPTDRYEPIRARSGC